MKLFFQRPAVEWLIVGLGNPGPNYERTRHNAGFRVVEQLARELNVKVDRVRFRAKTARAELEGHTALLLMPQTFMNASGLSVAEAASFYKIPRERVLVISDDVDLPVGKIRIRREGSAGGHNGLKSIDYSLASDDYARLRIGTGNGGFAEGRQVDFVLGELLLEERRALPELLERAIACIKCCATEGIDRAMTQFNRNKPAADTQSASSSPASSTKKEP